MKKMESDIQIIYSRNFPPGTFFAQSDDVRWNTVLLPLGLSFYAVVCMFALPVFIRLFHSLSGIMMPLWVLLCLIVGLLPIFPVGIIGEITINPGNRLWRLALEMHTLALLQIIFPVIAVVYCPFDGNIRWISGVFGVLGGALMAWTSFNVASQSLRHENTHKNWSFLIQISSVICELCAIAIIFWFWMQLS